MKSSLRHEKPSIRKTGREAPGSEFDLDRRGSKETINDQGVSSAAAANPMAFDPRKMKRNSAIDVRRELCEKIHAKMQFLEEDTRLMKEAILDCVKDRDILMSEVSHKLHMIREHLSIISSECRLDCPPRVCSFDPLKVVPDLLRKFPIYIYFVILF